MSLLKVIILSIIGGIVFLLIFFSIVVAVVRFTEYRYYIAENDRDHESEHKPK